MKLRFKNFGLAALTQLWLQFRLEIAFFLSKHESNKFFLLRVKENEVKGLSIENFDIHKSRP